MELFDLIDLAEAVAITSRNRKESRGMHKRIDYTFTNPLLNNKFQTIRAYFQANIIIHDNLERGVSLQPLCTVLAIHQFIVKISSLLNQWMITYIIFWHCFYIFGYGSRGMHKRIDYTFTNPLLNNKFQTIRKNPDGEVISLV